MKIATNVPALKALTATTRSNNSNAKSILRLSTGSRINTSKDDPAGLAISRRLQIQLNGLESASSNASDGISLVQTAEGALQEITNMIQRMRELALQAANDTMETDDREKIQQEVDSLINEINDIVDRTEFNKTKLLTGQAGRQSANLMQFWDPTLNSGAGGYGTIANSIMAITSYISDQVSPGNLTYQLEEVGLPAQTKSANVNSAIPLTAGTIDYTSSAAQGLSGKLYINSALIQIDPDDTGEDIYRKILEASEVGNYNVLLDGKDLILTHNEAGSDFSLEIKDDTGGDLVKALFLGVASTATSVSQTGTDAKVSGLAYKNADGTTNTSFANTHTVKVTGNKVVVTATNGWQMNIDLRIQMDGNGKFSTLDGLDIDANGNLIDPTPPGTNPITSDFIQMTLNVKEYGPLKLQIGPNFQQQMEINIPSISALGIGLVNMNYYSAQNCTQALIKCDNALALVNEARGRLGAYANRLDSTVASLDNTAEATSKSLSQIKDTDMARESTEYATSQVLIQAGLSILAQCNQRPQQVLMLIQ